VVVVCTASENICLSPQVELANTTGNLKVSTKRGAVLQAAGSGDFSENLGVFALFLNGDARCGSKKTSTCHLNI
jgi:hypothetical protein